MPRLHSSVAYCTCDQIVATIELVTCANDDCSNPCCPDCRVATSDPDVFACSARCAAALSPISNGLKLDAATHTYTFNGERVVGVTSALHQAGIIDFAGIPQHVLDGAAARGKAVHLALEYLDRGTLDRDSLDPEIEGHVQAYEHFCIDSGFYCALSERSRFHVGRRYAGTFDRTGMLSDDFTLLDFKSGAFYEGHFVQLSLYLHFHPNPRRFRALALQTFSTGKYRVHEMPVSKFDYYSGVGFSAVTCAQWRLAERRA